MIKMQINIVVYILGCL